MTPKLLICLCLALGSAVVGQDPAAAKARAEYKSMKAAYDSEMDAYYLALRRVALLPAYKEARDAKDRDAMNAMRASVQRPDKRAWSEKFQKAAALHAGSPGEVPFLGWLALWSGNKKMATSSVETILDQYADSADLLELAEYVGVLRRSVGAELHAKALDMLMASDHKMIKANALYSKGYSLVVRRGVKPSDEEAVKGRQMLAECARLAKGTALALRAAAPEFEKARLQIGMEAPDIVGEDLDGVSFKLSDYRGKVVVLDFWGDW